MFRTVGDQVSLWEAVLPAELLKLPDELARVGCSMIRCSLPRSCRSSIRGSGVRARR